MTDADEFTGCVWPDGRVFPCDDGKHEFITAMIEAMDKPKKEENVVINVGEQKVLIDNVMQVKLPRRIWEQEIIVSQGDGQEIKIVLQPEGSTLPIIIE